MSGKKGIGGIVALRGSIELSDEKAPTSITLLKRGLNVSDHYGEGDGGTFFFDDVSAAMVMQKFQTDGRARLYGDWNHGMLKKAPTREEAASCCSFVPSIDDEGNLIASDIDWTDDGRADVESRRYNLYSPAYSWAWGDDGICRVTGLINFALVNLAGLKGIPELMAASAAITTTTEEPTMSDFEIKYTETKTKLDASEQRVRELEGLLAKSGSATHQIAAMSIAVGLKAEAKDDERISAMTGLVALRSGVYAETATDTPEKAVSAVKGLTALRAQVFAMTGKNTPEEAMGALQVMATTAGETAALKKKIEDDQIAAMTAEWDGVWKKIDDEKRMTPAKATEVKASLLAFSGGRMTREAVNGAKVLQGLDPVVAAMGAGHVQAKTGASLLNDADRAMWEQMGGAAGRLSLEDIQKFKEQQIAAGRSV